MKIVMLGNNPIFWLNTTIMVKSIGAIFMVFFVFFGMFPPYDSLSPSGHPDGRRQMSIMYQHPRVKRALAPGFGISVVGVAVP